jgi:hypothetical protein
MEREKRTETGPVEAGVPQEQTLSPLDEMNDLYYSTSTLGPRAEQGESKPYREPARFKKPLLVDRQGSEQ